MYYTFRSHFFSSFYFIAAFIKSRYKMVKWDIYIEIIMSMEWQKLDE